MKTLSIKVWWLTSVSYIQDKPLGHGLEWVSPRPCFQGKVLRMKPQKPNSNSLFPKDTKSFKI